MANAVEEGRDADGWDPGNVSRYAGMNINRCRCAEIATNRKGKNGGP